MKSAPLHPRETERIKKLESYKILFTENEQAYDDLVSIASQICNTPIALVSLITPDKQWFKAKLGIDAEETSRDYAFCAHAIHQESVFIVQDTLEDERFHDNPLVSGEPNIRFYAGAPLITSDGLPLGTLCAIDREPKTLNKNQIQALNALSRQVMAQLELRAKKIHLEELNKEKDKYFSVLSHDLRSPITCMHSICSIMNTDLDEIEKKDLKEFSRILLNGCNDALHLIDQVIQWSKSERGLIDYNEKTYSSQELIRKSIDLLKPSAKVKLINLHLSDEDYQTRCDQNMITFTIRNLVSNAIKYTQPNGRVKITTKKRSQRLNISIQDNGIGVSASKIEELLQSQKHFSSLGTAGERGSGLGIKIVNDFLKKHNSKLEIESKEGAGSTFSFELDLA